MPNRYKILKADTFDNTFTVEDEEGHLHFVTGITVTGKLENKDSDLVGKEFTALLTDYISAASNVKFIETNEELANGD